MPRSPVPADPSTRRPPRRPTPADRPDAGTHRGARAGTDGGARRPPRSRRRLPSPRRRPTRADPRADARRRPPTPTPEPTPTPTPTPEPTPDADPRAHADPRPEPDDAGTRRSAADAVDRPPSSVRPISLRGTAPRSVVRHQSILSAAALLAARRRSSGRPSNCARPRPHSPMPRSTREVARAVAERMQGLADDGAAGCRRGRRASTSPPRTATAATVSSMPAVFGAGNDLLAGLGGVARVDADRRRRRQAPRRSPSSAPRTPTAAQERADAAWAAVDDVPVEALEAEVANAEQALADARQELADAAGRRVDAEPARVEQRLAHRDAAGRRRPAERPGLGAAGRGPHHRRLRPAPDQAARRRERLPPRHRPRGHLRDAGVRRDRRRRRRGRAEREPRQLDPDRPRLGRRDRLRAPRRGRHLRRPGRGGRRPAS